MTEEIAFEVRPKRGKKLQENDFVKSIFLPLGPLGGMLKWDQKKGKKRQ